MKKAALVHYIGRMIHSLDAKEAQELIARGTFDVVDVREPREWSTGHLPGSRLVPLDRFRASPAAALRPKITPSRWSCELDMTASSITGPVGGSGAGAA